MIYKLPNYLLALISALLLSAGWFAPFTCLLFFAWIPLLSIEDKITNSNTVTKKKLNILGYSYLTFFVWNLCTTWWIYYASFSGAVMAIFCNSILMCTTFVIWYNLKQRLNKPWAIWLLIPIWLGFEYGHTLWDLTWTWLTLGNAFAFTHNWVQWYEFTGTSGGSLWVLIVNILLFKIVKQASVSVKQFALPIVVIILPVILSFLILQLNLVNIDNNKIKLYKTVIVQPNIDPYNEKFYFEPEVQLSNLLKQLKVSVDSTTDFLVLPETYLTENIFEGKENESPSLHFLQDSILYKYPKLTIITGANTLYAYKKGETPSATASKFSNADAFYDSYNTGMQLNNSGITLYHKSKLVPGVEKMPFPILFKPFENFAINLGGTMGSLGTQTERTVFYSHNKQVGIAPVICYESVYPDYVAEYVKNGANLIFILTNDGWWQNTPGHKQHLAFAKLRAIETRREIARCANTGISCFISPYGEIEQATLYWEKAIITKNMMPNNKQTFFVHFGDLISYSSSLLAILLLSWSQVLRFKKN